MENINNSQNGQMIFGKEYDLSLWYMLKVNNIYKKEVINFVKELPQEFLDNIRVTYINGIDHNSGVGDDQNPFYNVQSDKDPNVYYKFYIMCGELFMIKYHTIDGVITRTFSLCLFPVNLELLQKLPNISGISLGDVGKGNYPAMNYVEVEYYLKKTRLGNMIIHTYDFLCNWVNIKLYKLIKNLPYDVSLEMPTQSISEHIKENFDVDEEKGSVRKLTKK